MIRNWGIRSRVLLLALVPVISLGFVLGSYLTRVRVHDLRNSVQTLGSALANQLASASEYGVYTHNLKLLHKLAFAVSREQGVESITIVDNTGHVLAEVAHTTDNSTMNSNRSIGSAGKSSELSTILTFTRPIFQQTAEAINPTAQKNMSRASIRIAGQSRSLIGKVTVKLSEAHFTRQQTQIIINGGIIMLSCLALSILLALIIGGSVAVPITRVIEMVRRFSSGDYTARVTQQSGGEIGQLETGINHMAANAERSQQELQAQVNQATAELRETMDEMEVKNIELDLARKRALEASRVKSTFLSNMSHEIRTPMNAIVGFTGLLGKTRLTKVQKDYLDVVKDSAVNLLALIDDVLSLQSLESAKRAKDIPFALSELLEHSFTLVAPEAYKKKLELILCIPVDAPMNYVGDSVKIFRVIMNLLNNAVKFTEQGQVLLSVYTQRVIDKNVNVSIKVKDTGIGIRQENLKELFTPFTMLNSQKGQIFEGTGLGLAISKQLVDAMGGLLSVTSVPGEGSEFCIELSLSERPLSHEKLTAPARVLVYENNPDMLAALQARFTRLGCRVDPCRNLNLVSSYLHSNRKNKFDIVILSLSYKELTHYSRLINALHDDQKTPRLFLINSLESGIHNKLSRALNGLCLPKCIETSALEDNVHRLLKKRKNKTTKSTLITQTTAQPLIGCLVLVVEDNPINRRLIALQLRDLGAEVVQTGNGASALAHFKKRRPDAVLLDMRLGKETGLEVAQRIAEVTGDKPVPTLILSAASDDAEIEASRALGISHWLLKPVDEQILAKSLLEAIHKSHYPAFTNHASEEIASALMNLRPEIFRMLQNDLPDQKKAVFDAWQGNDITALASAIHTLRGTAALCRFSQLSYYCSRIEEQLIASKNMKSIISFKLKLKKELDLLIKTLKSGVQEKHVGATGK